jgi:hypothetical protein
MYVERSFQIKSVAPLAYAIPILTLLLVVVIVVAAADVIDTSTNIT